MNVLQFSVFTLLLYLNYKVKTTKSHDCPPRDWETHKDAKCGIMPHAALGYNVWECHIPCEEGDSEFRHGVKSFMCYEGRWYKPAETCTKCPREEEKGNCVQSACQNVGTKTAKCYMRVRSGGNERCQCECKPTQNAKPWSGYSFRGKPVVERLNFSAPTADCSKLKCVDGAKGYCWHFRSGAWNSGETRICQCMKSDPKAHFGRD